MSNPWSDIYKNLREPYLQEKMAKKDYDGDGKIESGKDEYMGSRDKAIKKAMGKKVEEHHQKDADGKVIEHDDTTPSSVEEGTLGTLHVADMKANTPAWKNRMGVNKQGKRLYSFGQDLIQKMSYEPEGEMVESNPAKVAKPSHSNWREDFVWQDEVEEAIKRPKLDIQEKGVKNKVEINPDDGLKEEKKN